MPGSHHPARSGRRLLLLDNPAGGEDIAGSAYDRNRSGIGATTLYGIDFIAGQLSTDRLHWRKPSNFAAAAGGCIMAGYGPRGGHCLEHL